MVLNTRRRSGVVIRYRKCVNGHRFQTEERIKGEIGVEVALGVLQRYVERKENEWC